MVASSTPSETLRDNHRDAERNEQHDHEPEGREAWLLAAGAFLIYTATWYVFTCKT